MMNRGATSVNEQRRPVHNTVQNMALFQLSIVLLLFSCIASETDHFHDARMQEQKKITKNLGLEFPQRNDPKRNEFLVKKYSAPKFMLNLFNELESMDASGFHIKPSRRNYVTERMYLEENQVDTVISFFKYDHDERQRKFQNETKIKFDIKINNVKENVRGGELKIFKRRPRTPMADILCNISVYNIEKTRVLLDTRVAHARDTRWFNFNVTRAIREWSRDPLSNNGLMVVVVDARGHVINSHEFGMVNERGNKEKRPYLLGFGNTLRDFSTFSHEVLVSRDRRSTRDTSEHLMNKPCHLKKFYVNFRKIGLHETIIAPDGYDAYLCTGTCLYPLMEQMNVTYHALVQSLAHLASEHVPNPCCSPNQLKSLSILYFDDNNNIVLKGHPNMVATSCACQ